METLRQMQEPRAAYEWLGVPTHVRPVTVCGRGVGGIGVTANGQNQTASVGGRVPTVGLTSGVVNGSAVYTQLYLGLFDRSLGRNSRYLAEEVSTVVAETSRLATKT